jgi:flagella basal body P-ring formation protein FlgA
MGSTAWGESRKIQGETIKSHAREYLFETLEWDPSRIDINLVYEGKELIVPEGNVDFDCKLPGHKKRVGRVHFMCLVKVDGRTKKRIRLYADVTVAYDVLRPTRNLKAGHIVGDEDLEMARVKSTQVLRNTISSPEEIVGHRLMLNLDQGEPFSNHMLQKVPMVKTGDQILIIAQKGSLRVTVPGVVKQNGFKHDTIQVQNVHSKKMVLGTVIDSRTVRINF